MSAASGRPIAVALHGGCGVMARNDLLEADWAEAQATMQVALRRGWSLLAEDASALDAVEAIVVVLEDSPHFNAGHGAALNREGVHELDAAIMDGSTGSVSSRASVLMLDVEHAVNHEFCMIPSASRAPLAKR